MRFRARRTFERELRGQPVFQAHLAAAAVNVAAEIQVAAQPYRHTGYYIRRVRVRRNRVVLLDPFWHLSEYGSINNPPQANARRGIRAAGLRFEDHRAALS